MNVHIFWIAYLIVFSNAENICEDFKESVGSKDFINQIFLKYGSGNETNTISLPNFNLLMNNISLGRIEVTCEPNDIICQKEGIDKHLKLGKESDHNHDHKRRRRQGSFNDAEEHHQHWLQHITNVIFEAFQIFLCHFSDSFL